MAENTGEVKMTPTLGLTGLTMNAMALIAPGAFLWLTFSPRRQTGATGPAMWLGIFFALLLCLATAVSYAELAKLYPGPGSSYFFAEQSFLNHDKAWKYARLLKFIVGWGSHLYYWIYPGVMVAVTGVFCRLYHRHPLAEFHERVEPRPDVHDAGRDPVFLRRRLYRAPRGKRLHGGQRRHQRDSDLRADRFLRDGHRLSHEPSPGKRGLAVRFDFRRGLQLRIRDDQPNRQWNGDRCHHPRCQHGAAAQAGREREAGSLSRQLRHV